MALRGTLFEFFRRSRAVKRRPRFALLAVFLTALLALPTAAPAPAQDSPGRSLPDALEAIDHARVATRILYITAHPDDETGALLTYLSRGLGAEVALLTLTRGEGGQNAIGPEQGPQMAVIRSAELLAATHVYHVRLFFTRAPDFGFSKTMEETLKVWGDTALSDMVRVIRTFRPTVVINGWGNVRGGHGNHQSSGYLTPKAFEAAGDPQKFPDQLAEGLPAWKPFFLLQPDRGEGGAAFRVPTDQVSPTWGESYNEIAAQGFANHRSQGVSAFLGSNFLRRTTTLIRADGAPLDPSVLAQPIVSLGDRYPAAKTFIQPLLELADQALAEARAAELALRWEDAVSALARAGKQLLQAKAALGARMVDPPPEVQWELSHAREKIDAALAEAAALRVDVQADRSDLVAGEEFHVRVDVRQRAGLPIQFEPLTPALPAGWNVTRRDADPNSGALRFTVSIPPGAQPPHTPGDWMFPFPPPLVRALVRGTLEGYSFETAAPAMAPQATTTRVDILPLRLVPALTLQPEPSQFVLIEKRLPKTLTLLARVHSYSNAPAKVTAGLDLPPGWQSSPDVTREFSGPGDQLVRFELTPPPRIAVGKYSIRLWATRDGEKFRTSLTPLPSMPTYLWSESSAVPVHVFDISVPENLRVGYIASDIDPVPEALQRLGIKVEMLDPVALAFSDLSRFDAIVVGIRAYDLRSDLAKANQRLLDYSAAGGTLVVQYQRNPSWDSLKPAPYPATLGQAPRTTDENSPVSFLVPDSPVLNFPNKITQDDFKGWLQDRGLYYWSQWDAKYQAVLGVRDPGEQEQKGSLLYARTGKGVYIYTGLAFFRQLPEGVPGAYRLFVNLISQSRAKP
jgi:LmbE family N-acetylglucosaminyl deacetylase